MLWIAFPTKKEALQSEYQENAPGSKRQIEEIIFGALVDDSPKNLAHPYEQYYWAEDLMS